MTTRIRMIAGSAAAALAAGSVLAGVATASAEPVEPAGSTGSVGSSALGDLGGAVSDLVTAGEALNGPVTMVPNSDGGPTVTYTNRGTVSEQCLGFSAPYSTIADNDLDVGYDKDDLGAALLLLGGIEAGGGVSLLLGDESGEPISEPDNPDTAETIAENMIPLFFFGLDGMPVPRSVVVAPGETVSWTAGSPATPAAAGIVCLAEAAGATPVTNFGIDKQVVADQINGKIPGGSVDVVSAGSISGGSVDTGVAMLGSLADDVEE